MSQRNHLQWELDIKNILLERMQTSNSDVQGFMGGHSFELAQEWTKGSSAEVTAKVLLDWDLKELVKKFDCKTHNGFWDCDCYWNYQRAVSVFTVCNACNQNYEDAPSSRLAELIYFGVIPESEADKLAKV